MNNDMNSRVISVGEAHVDPNRHITFTPMHQYDEDVEFVSDKAQILKEKEEPFDDSKVRTKIADIEEEIYRLYAIKSEDERSNFLRGSSNAIYPFMEAILQVDNNLTFEE